MQTLTSYTVSFFRFWYNFVVGDDWTLAAAAAVGIVADLLIHYGLGYNADWYVLPIVVLAALVGSLYRQPYRQ